MSLFEIIMPKLGESVEEATITRWFKKAGDTIVEDEALLEIATDKVDSEIPSPVAGTIAKILFNEGDKIAVGTLIAVINTDVENHASHQQTQVEQLKSDDKPEHIIATSERIKNNGRFYSPLVRTIATAENISQNELDNITGSGEKGRVTKNDLLKFLANRNTSQVPEKVGNTTKRMSDEKPKISTSISAGDEIIEMDRMRRLIADHMVMSVQTSPHVTNMVETDVTNLVYWRNRIKDEFEKKEKEKITYLPIVVEAVAKALKDYPMVNASVNGYQIILKKNINIGIAVALPTGNLIVPVIKNADEKNLTGLTKSINQLAASARANKLNPDDISGGTFTITNFGSFRNTMGTPIINQPQVAILGIGTIEKKPAVIETPTGDMIGIRHKVFLSLTYDHRIIDGALGGAFLRKVADYLEEFPIDRSL
jgi:2-oxoglutarate dehydrogenase E2 component (dihydrolipoamide succinyltransferase)